MRGHDAIGIELQAFVMDTMLKTFEQDVLVFLSDKQVNPANDGKGDKVQLVLISEFVFAAHSIKAMSKEEKLQARHKYATAQGNSCILAPA